MSAAKRSRTCSACGNSGHNRNNRKFHPVIKKVALEPVVLEPPDDDCDKGDECVICFEPLTTDIMWTICCHKYHAHCLLEWFQRKKECPECKTIQK